jgi:hypothetical protein
MIGTLTDMWAPGLTARPQLLAMMGYVHDPLE